MSKEVIRPSQFARVSVVQVDDLELTQDQINQLKAIYNESTSKFKEEQLITGKVVSVNPTDGVVLDINYKSHGFIPKYEFTPHELKGIKAGDELDVLISSLENAEGAVVLSYEKAKAQKAWERINKLFEAEEPVEGIVLNTVKGGLNVDIGVPAFLPGSQVDLQRVVDFQSFVGKPVTAHILKINRKRGNVIISRRKFLSERRSEARRRVMGDLEENQVIKGVVKNITNYGVFVDVCGVDGLLHITDMTWGRISHPSELVNIGDEITVKVISIDRENSKISLGMKQLAENPWTVLTEGISEGSKVKGKVSSITDYGMFVEIQQGVEGLVHISEVSWTDRVNDLNKLYKVGDIVEAVVVGLDKDNRRMSLSVKQLEEDPWKKVSNLHKVGDKIKGTVTNVTEFGVFIQVLPGVDGLAHVSDLSWTEHIDHPNRLYKKGDAVEAVILSIDPEHKKVSLGIKQLEQDPWEVIENEYPQGKLVEGEVMDISGTSATVKLPHAIKAFVKASDIGTEKLEDILKVGEKREFRVVNRNKEDRKVILSINLDAPVKAAAPKKAKAVSEEAPKKESPKTKSGWQLELEKLSQNK